MAQRPIVILSPHCDDAVLSLGAWIAAQSEGGQTVRVVTVFGNDIDSTLPPGSWDTRAGFLTSADAARARRHEDALALQVLGAEQVMLSFPDSSYVQGTRDEAQVLEALAPHLADAAEVLVPGFPLIHGDHRWLAGLDFASAGPAPVRFYVEQPYAWWNRSTTFNRIQIEKARVAVRHLRRKVQSVRCYRSQVPLLGGRRLFGPLLVNDILGPGEGFRPRPTVLASASEKGMSKKPQVFSGLG